MQDRGHVIGAGQRPRPGGVGQDGGAVGAGGVDDPQSGGQSGPGVAGHHRRRHLIATRQGHRGGPPLAARRGDQVLPDREQGSQAANVLGGLLGDGDGGQLVGRVIAFDNGGQEAEGVLGGSVAVGAFGSVAHHIRPVGLDAAGDRHVQGVAAGPL
jgi:hypothetical protein